MSDNPPDARIAIVGAGPAGIRAAQTLVEHGLRPILISEAPTGGGQIYRRQPAGFTRTSEKLYGSEASKANNIHSTFDGLLDRIDFRAETTVWNVFDGLLYLEARGEVSTLAYDQLILATGAMDLVLPIPGWTLPGVYTLGGAQIALKHQGCAIGADVVFAGSGPLLYLVAYQYMKAGARVAGVFDTSPFSNKVAALPAMLTNARATLLGISYMAKLKYAGVKVVQGIIPLEIVGDNGVSAFRYKLGARVFEVPCSAVGTGYGVKPESQLADLAGCAFRYDAAERMWIVAQDGAGRAGGNIYVAGDGAAIGGADIAELTGEYAAISLLDDLGIRTDHGRRARIATSLRKQRRFRAGIGRAFPLPQALVPSLPKDTIICRCEAVRIGDMDAAFDALGPGDVNRLKAFSRCGMGRCQGRVCGPAIGQYLAHLSHASVESVGRIRGQAPVKPLMLAAAATAAEDGNAFSLARK